LSAEYASETTAYAGTKERNENEAFGSKALRVVEIEAMANAYEVPKHVVGEALREIRKNLTRQEAAKLI